MTPHRRDATTRRALKGALFLVVIYLGYKDFNLPGSVPQGEALFHVLDSLNWLGLWLVGLVASLVLLRGDEGIAGFNHLFERFTLAALITFLPQHISIEPIHYPGVRMFANWLMVSLVLTVVLGAFRKRALEAERQRRLADVNRERALRARLAPHFIFNTLNTLQAQIALDPIAARASTFKLAKLFRQVLAVQERDRIPLSEELTFVQAYLDLEQLRFGPRLRVELDLPPEVLSLPVPPLSLQILLENALKHGVAPLEDGGVVRLSAYRHEQAWSLRVEDPGPGFSRGTGTGTALETLRGQLRACESFALGLQDGVHTATLTLERATGPFRERAPHHVPSTQGTGVSLPSC